MSDSASRVPISFSASDLIMVTDACEPGFTTHRVVFLTLSFKSLLLSVVKQKRTSGFACPSCLAEKQGFVK